MSPLTNVGQDTVAINRAKVQIHRATPRGAIARRPRMCTYARSRVCSQGKNLASKIVGESDASRDREGPGERERGREGGVF